MTQGDHVTKSPIHRKRRPVSSSIIAPVRDTPPEGRQRRSQLRRLPSAAAKPWPKLPPAMNMRIIVGMSATAADMATTPSELLSRDETKSVKAFTARKASRLDSTIHPKTPMASSP